MDLEHFKDTPPAATPQTGHESRWDSKVVHRGAAAIVLALMLSACGTQPFVDGRREAGQTTPVGISTADRVAICYSSQSTTPATLIAMAQTECAKTNRAAVFDGQDTLRCALLAPTRVFFKCVAK